MFVATRKWISDWIRLNPVLINGEIGQEINTGRLKIGDGKTRWTDLTYIPMGGPTDPSGTGAITINSIIDASSVGKNLLGAASSSAARSAIGAGTSNLQVGTSATDAKRGDYVPTWSELGMVPTSSLPPLAIKDTFVVASQAAMLALTAQRGDVAIRTDVNKTFFLATDNPSTLADWKEALSPTGAPVSSVNGKTGAIVIAIADIATLQAALDAKAAWAPLNLWAAKRPEDMATGTLTYNSAGALTSANVTWPNGATGAYSGTASTTFPDAIDSYTITHVLNGTTTTYTQPAVTRDSTSGQVTSRPAITVA